MHWLTEEGMDALDVWLTEEGMDALDALAPVVQTDCEPDDYDAFVKAVLDEIEAEQRVEEDSESDSDIEVVNEPPVILLNQACEKMRELMVFLSLALTSDKTKLIGSIG